MLEIVTRIDGLDLIYGGMNMGKCKILGDK